jgi:hypothetical protein
VASPSYRHDPFVGLNERLIEYSKSGQFVCGIPVDLTVVPENDPLYPDLAAACA